MTKSSDNPSFTNSVYRMRILVGRRPNLLITLAALALLVPCTVCAQQYGARSFSLAPDGLNVMSLMWERQDLSLDPSGSILFEDADVRIDDVSLPYSRYFDLFGKSAQINAAIPYVFIDASTGTTFKRPPLTGLTLQSLFAEDAPQKSDLPKVLIIGDSISIGYTPYVAQILKDKAVVTHHKGNAQHTGTGLKNIDQWVGKTKWDVIHFNWGLWDLCYRHPKSKVQGNRDKVNGKITHTLEQYEKNLDELVTRLKRTDAKLIWAHTTVVPENEAGRIVGDEKKYNDVAAKIMKKHGVAINDLHSLSKSFPADHFKKPGDVHYTADGYAKLAKQVAEKLLATMGCEQKEFK